MRFHQPLDELLSRDVHVRLLRFLCRKGGAWSGRRLAVELAVHPTTAHTALRRLRQATLLDFQRSGNGFVYSLREEHVVVTTCLRPLFEQEAQLPARLHALIRRGLTGLVASDIVSAALYGSLARGQERPTSDIDLFVLVRSEPAKPRVRLALDRIGEHVLRAFGSPLAPYLNTVREARRKARQGLPLLRDMLGSHRLLWGKPLAEALHGRAA